MDTLSPLTALERLELFNVAGLSDEYLPESASAFSMLQQLTALDLGGNAISDEDLQPACTGLRQLCLSGVSSPSLVLNCDSRCAFFLEMRN